jgi:hypothetical protein
LIDDKNIVTLSTDMSICWHSLKTKGDLLIGPLFFQVKIDGAKLNDAVCI